MSSFDKEWLRLREAADHAARNEGLVQAWARHLQGRRNARLVDIGCGTGSTWRNLHARLSDDLRWLLVDNDPILLEEAERRIAAEDDRVRFRCKDLSDLSDLRLADVDVVTASALFDLCSEDLCRQLVDRLAAARCALYAALTYDGTIGWSLPHRLDDPVVAAFNRHQRTDKGIGQALGPDATVYLEQLLTERGFRVMIARSPWIMDGRFTELNKAFLHGLCQALAGLPDLPPAEVEAWLTFRLSQADADLCEVGHFDLLALPP